jgi:CDP-2,3-bis-(O-geranylgeranyl)-sn-glycerol synthase
VEYIITEAAVFVWKSIYLLIPGLFANMAPVLFKKVRFLAYQVDFGKKWRGKPIFGSHKTFRGFFFGILSAIIIVYIQKLLFLNIEYFRSISFIPYSEYNTFLLGFLVGFGVLFGDLIESFFKRRANIKPGKPWIPWDQLDCVIGGLLFLFIVYIPPWQVILFLVLAIPVIHILVNHIGYYLGINKSKW